MKNIAYSIKKNVHTEILPTLTEIMWRLLYFLNITRYSKLCIFFRLAPANITRETGEC